MITVACVEVGNYLGRGAEYVAKLRAMVKRNLSLPHKFVVLTDNGDDRHGVAGVIWLPSFLSGWWAKVGLFSEGLFKGRVLYLDLDTVVVGSLDNLVQHKGILHLADWGWTKNDYGSGVMVWDAGEHEEIYTRYTQDVPKRFRGDQDWLSHIGGWPALPKGINVSYRYHAKKGPPPGAVTVSFHGRPKCHEVTTGWVSAAWR